MYKWIVFSRSAYYNTHTRIGNLQNNARFFSGFY